MDRTDNIKTLVRNGILAAIFIVTTQLNPLGYGAIQFRISEALAIIPMYQPQYMVGILLGNAIANMNSPLGILDVFVGVFGGYISYKVATLAKTMQGKILVYSLTVSSFVTMLLVYILNVPIVVTYLGILASQLIILTIGNTIYKGYRRR